MNSWAGCAMPMTTPERPDRVRIREGGLCRRPGEYCAAFGQRIGRGHHDCDVDQDFEEQDESERRGAERVAACRVAVVETPAEPAHALLGGAVGEGIGYDFASGASLQRVVADRRGGCKGFFYIARFQPVMAILGVMRPDAGKAVGLEFLAHQ